jgi:hypothetical protein
VVAAQATVISSPPCTASKHTGCQKQKIFFFRRGAAGESDDEEEEVEEEPGSGDAGSDAESDGVESYDESEGDE